MFKKKTSDKEKPEGCAVQGGAAPDRAAEDQELKESMDRIKHKIVVLSGKGGVGKSTVAVNLAAELASGKNQVGLLDVDIHGPSVPRLLGLQSGKIGAVDEKKLMPVDYNSNFKVMSIGFMLEKEEDAIVWRGPLKHSIIKQFLKDVLWGNLDYLVVDSPPGTGDEPLAVCQLIDKPAGAVIVTTPQEVSLSDVRKSISFCRQLNIPVLGVVENMSGFVCPHCGEETPVFKNGGGEVMAKDMGVAFLGRIPLEPGIAENGDDGRPFSSHDKTSGSAGSRAFADIVEKIIKEVKK